MPLPWGRSPSPLPCTQLAASIKAEPSPDAGRCLGVLRAVLARGRAVCVHDGSTTTLEHLLTDRIGWPCAPLEPKSEAGDPGNQATEQDATGSEWLGPRLH
jgi:hypothetical protein